MVGQGGAVSRIRRAEVSHEDVVVLGVEFDVSCVCLVSESEILLLAVPISPKMICSSSTHWRTANCLSST
jgi:hypothetical protein